MNVAGRPRIIKVLVISIALLCASLYPAGISRATHEGCQHYKPGIEAHVVEGTNGDDHCHGTDDYDNVFGKDGSDDLSGRALNDSVRGDNGHDLLNGDDGADYVEGGAGYDRIRGGSGHDQGLSDWLYGDDADKVCDNEGHDEIQLQDGDGMDIWYKAQNDGYDDVAQLNTFDAINNGGCQIPGS